MNNYHFEEYIVNDNSNIINKLTNELSLIKEKLKICQSQLISITTKYKNCLNLNQKLKEQNNEFSKKILKNQKEDDELYDIMDNLRKQVKKLSDKLTISENKNSKIKKENEQLIEENKLLKNEILKLKDFNNNNIIKTHHIKNKRSVEIKKLKNIKFLNQNHSRNLSDNLINRNKKFIEITNDYINNSLKTIENNFKKIKINFKKNISENYNNETEDKTFTPKSEIIDEKKEINKTINSIHSKDNIFDNEINISNNKTLIIQKSDSLNNINQNIIKTEDNIIPKSNYILYSKKKIPNISLRKVNQLNKNNITNISITDISFDESLSKNKIFEKKVPLGSLRKSLIIDNLNNENLKEKFSTIQIKRNNNLKNSNLNLLDIEKGIYRIDSKSNKIIFFNLITYKFESEQFSNCDNYSFLKKYTKKNFITYTNKTGFYILTENEIEENNNFFYLNPSKHFLRKLISPKAYHKNSALISYSNNDNIICFSGSNTTSVEIYDILKKNWSFLPYLNNAYSDSSLLIIDKYKLYCFFGYDYIKGNYNKNIIWIDLKNPIEWNVINVNLEIKNHFAFINNYFNNNNNINVFILGGVLSNNITNSDMIQVIISNNKSEVYSNYNKGNLYIEPFLFNESFINFYDINNNIQFNYGFDKNGNVHIIDVTNVKHRIFEFKRE